MNSRVLSALRCPVCQDGLRLRDASSLACDSGHHFDVARQGYVTLVARPLRVSGDTGDMVAARAAFLKRGHYRPLHSALAQIAASHRGLVIDVGAGTGTALAACMGSGRVGLAIDVSKAAARRAARVHDDVVAVVADAQRTLPVMDAVASLALVSFAPRNAAELSRVLQPDGELVVVTPLSDHLSALRAHVELLAVDPDKERRLDDALGGHFSRHDRQELRFAMELDHGDARRLIEMGPSAFHLDRERASAALVALPAPFSVEAALRIDRWRPSR